MAAALAARPALPLALVLLCLAGGAADTGTGAGAGGAAGTGAGAGGAERPQQQQQQQQAAAHANMGRLLDGYDDTMYKTMRDDAPRTAAYAAAIERLAPGRVVLDIGTGQFALLATIAAKAGARYVYAIEGNRQAYERAKIHLAEQNLTHQIGLLYGYSANVSLQELPPPPSAHASPSPSANGVAQQEGWPGVELVIHELLGEIAGMEGAAFAIHDAHRRHIAPRPPPSSSGSSSGGGGGGSAQQRRVSVPFGARSFIAPTAFP